MIDNTNLQNQAVNTLIEQPVQMPINPGIKPSGAPVSFSPRAQSTITSAFGNPIANSYDRAVSGPTPIPEPVISPNVPPSNF
jgi:hypothetical protein